jgi:hypothetical protein
MEAAETPLATFTPSIIASSVFQLIVGIFMWKTHYIWQCILVPSLSSEAGPIKARLIEAAIQALRQAVTILPPALRLH